MEIVVIDERLAPIEEDGSNLDHPDIEQALSGLRQAEVIIAVLSDGVFVRRGTGRVSLMRTKGEPEMSLDKAHKEKAMRDDARQAETAEPTMNKFKRVWDQEDNSGTEHITQQP